MFTALLRIAPIALTGITGLNVRRQLGLPADECSLFAPESPPHGYCIRLEIPELVARGWFDDEQVVDNVKVPLQLCCPGDVVIKGQSGLALNPDLPAERLLQIYTTTKLYEVRTALLMAQAHIEQITETPASESHAARDLHAVE